MEFDEFTAKLNHYRSSGTNKGCACCPAHDDAKPSLSVWLDDKGKIAFDCKAGCGHYEVLQAMDLRETDLYTDDAELLPKWDNAPEPSTALAERPTASLALCSTGTAKLVDEYHYLDACGNQLKKQRFQREDGSKTFRWMHRSGDGIWKSGGTGETVMPYNYNNPAFEEKKDVIVFVEGEKDVKTCVQLGIRFTVSLPDGAGSKWKDEYNSLVAGRKVYIIPDCDNAGYDYRDRIQNHVKDYAASVFTLDLAFIWKDVTGEDDPPEKADITDLLTRSDAESVKNKLAELIAYTHRITPPEEANLMPEKAESAEDAATEVNEAPNSHEPLPIFRKLTDVEETEAEWLIDKCIPKGVLTLIAGPGGYGKTSLMCSIAADISNGKPTIMNPNAAPTEPKTVMILSTEDSVSSVLKAKLRIAGANQSNIIVMDTAQDRSGELKNMKFGTAYFSSVIRHFKPDLVILDPLQGFIPATLNMASRNAMRDCMQTLITLGEETGSTFVSICHTNKKQCTNPRDLLADSADLWDIARCVWFVGRAGSEEERYLANEKNSYTRKQPTVLFELNDAGQPECTGTTEKRTSEFQQEASRYHPAMQNVQSQLTQAIVEILHVQAGYRISSKSLVGQLGYYGEFTDKQIRRAKDHLKEKGWIRYEKEGKNTGSETYIVLTDKALREESKPAMAAAEKRQVTEESSTVEKLPAAIKTTVRTPAWVAEAEAARRAEILGQLTLDEVPASPAMPKLKVNALPPDDEAGEDRLGYKEKWQPTKAPWEANPKYGPIFDVTYDGKTYRVQVPTKTPTWARYCSKGILTWQSDWMSLEDSLVS